MGAALSPYTAAAAQRTFDREGVLRFLSNEMRDSGTGAYRSVPNGPVTLYGTVYASLTAAYLGGTAPDAAAIEFIAACQDPATGLFIGPELAGHFPAADATHDREHLLLHSVCTALPACLHFDIPVPYPVHFAHKFADKEYLSDWLSRCDLSNAWLEGNNLLFVGQLLVYLRDVERLTGADVALDAWFEWLDTHADPHTGLWGTQEGCDLFGAMAGGYHQLLVYYYEGHPVCFPEQLVDSVLSLQHADGGFSPGGGGGACEDVDAADILVNLYKLQDYRRPAIRQALRRLTASIVRLQNADGGFPYTRGRPQSHMGIPGTIAPKDESTAFATWFRVHTLALAAEILTDEPATGSRAFGFTRHLSMGWHKPWEKAQHRLGFADRLREIPTVIERSAHVSTSNTIAFGKRAVRYMARKLKDNAFGRHR